MKTYNAATKRPMNTKQKGTKPKYNVQEHDPKFKDRTEFKRPRAIRKLFGQVILTDKGVKDAVVSMSKVQIVKGTFIVFYTARTYHWEYDAEAMGDVRVYDSKRVNCRARGDIFWEVIEKREYFDLDGDRVHTELDTRVKKYLWNDADSSFEDDIDNAIDAVDESDFDSCY